MTEKQRVAILKEELLMLMGKVEPRVEYKIHKAADRVRVQCNLK